MLLWHYELTVPLGPMWAAFDERGRLRHLGFGGLDPRATMPVAPRNQRDVFRFLVRQVESYFAGTLRTFTVPLDPRGAEGEDRIWDEVATIPFGRTLELEKLVRRLGGEGARPKIEAALGHNPIEILIPVHRVVGPEGFLPAYAPGPELQKALLDHEAGFQTNGLS